MLSPLSSYLKTARNGTPSITTTRNIGCFQLNLHKSEVPTNILFERALSSPKDELLFFVQEPHVSSAKRISSVPPAYRSYFFSSPSGTKRSRAGIVASRSLQCSLLPQFSSPDLATVILHGGEKGYGHKDILLSSMYWDHDTMSSPQELLDVVSYASQHDVPLVLVGDFNGHHPEWGSKKVNARGQLIHDFISASKLNILNDGSSTFLNAIREEALDLSLVNDRASSLVDSNWRIDNHHTGSDHLTIRFGLSIPTEQVEKSRNGCRRSFKRVWAKFADTLEDLVQPHRKFLEADSDNILELNDRWNFLAKLLHRAEVECSSPVFISDRSIRMKRSNRWWNKHLASLRNKVRMCHSRFRTTKSPTDQSAYRKAFAKYKKELQVAKRESWKSYCSKYDSHPSKLLKSLGGARKEPQSVVCNGILSTTSQETLKGLTNRGGYSSLPHQSSGSFISDLPDHHNDEDLATASEIADLDALTKMVHGLKTGKASGPDGVCNRMLKEGWSAIKGPIQAIFHSSLKLGALPEEWKVSKGIFLPKDGKRNWTQPNSWRTISLAPSCLKLLEKAIKFYLDASFKIDHAIDDSQLGFRRGRGTDEALHLVVTKVESALLSHRFALGLFFDIKGAFDNVTFPKIMEALKRCNLPTILLKWVYSYLTQRKIIFTLKGTALLLYILKGTPQGGILSPLLWNLVINSLLASLKELLLEEDLVTGFADDLNTILVGDDPDQLMRRQQEVARTVDRWCTDNGLELSAEKSCLVLFTWRTKFSISEAVTIGGHALHFQSNVRYLGVLLNEKLSWTPHIKQATSKGSATLARANRVVGKTWGLSASRCKIILDAVVAPQVLYGCHLWAGDVKSCHNISLSKLFNGAARLTTKTPKWTSSATLEITSASTHLKSNAINKATKVLHRLKRLGKLQQTPRSSDPTKRGKRLKPHGDLLLRAAVVVPELSRDCDETFLTILGPPQFGISTSMDSTKSLLESFEETISGNDFSVFTDGSKMENKVGAGFVAYNKALKDAERVECWALSPENSVYQAEMSALKKAAEFILVLPEIPNNVAIYTDALSAVQAVAATSFNSKYVMDTRKTLDKLGSRLNVHWVKAHVGIKGNELADAAAKEGTRSSNILHVPIPKSAVVSAINQSHATLTINNIKINGNELTSKVPHFSLPCYSRFWSKLTGRKIRMTTAFLDNKAPLKRFLSKLGWTDSPQCHVCHTAEDTNYHLLVECEGLSGLRQQCFGRLDLTDDVLASIHPRVVLMFVKGVPVIRDYF